MSDYTAPLRDMRFVLNEVFQVSRLWAKWPGHSLSASARAGSECLLARQAEQF